MSYATQRDSFSRTRQDLIVLGVRECQNFYAILLQQYLIHTDEFDNADWTNVSVTITADDLTDPAGTVLADKIVFNAANDAVFHNNTGEVVTSKAYTGSVWAKCAAGTETVTIRVRNVAAGEIGAKQITLTTTWQRFFVYKLFTGGPVDDLVFEIIRLAGDDVTTAYFWRANCHRNDGDRDEEQHFPSVRRFGELVSAVATMASRCVASDAGDGSRCYYSRPTCQDPDNFNPGNSYESTLALRGLREYRFCRKDSPLPLEGVEVWPLLDSYSVAAQEIDPERSVTINERDTFTFFDDAGPGVWNIPQQSRSALVNTASGAGTFWRRWKAINQNYANPDGYLIRKAGFLEAGATESDFQQRGKFVITNVEFDSGERVKIKATDRLKLTVKEIPAKISDDNLINMPGTLTAGATSLIVDDAAEVSEPAVNAATSDPDYFVVLELTHDGTAEKVNVTARDLSDNTLTIQRGRWGTTAVTHLDNAVFREVAEFGTERTIPTGVPFGKNPIDIVVELLRMTGISMDDIDTTTLETERDNWLPSTIDQTTAVTSGVLFRRTLTEKTKIETLLTEIRETVMLFLWVNESQLITGKVFSPPLPTDTLTILTDDDNLIAGSIELDDNDESRLTRGLLAWDLANGEAGDKAEDYNNIVINLKIDEESENYYGDEKLKTILSKWIPATDTENPQGFIARIVGRFRRGAPILRARLEIKDDDIGLGQFVDVRTAKITNPDGSTDPRIMQVVKKKQRDDGTIEIEALDTGLFIRYGFWSGAIPDYTAADDDDKRYGYWTGPSGLVGSPGELGYHWW